MADQTGTERQRCNLRCLPAAVEWFYCEIDPTDHLISSPIYHSSQNTDSLSVWESDFKVPSTTQEMVSQTFQCLVMAGLIAGISEVDRRASDKAILRTVSLSAMQNSADQRRKSFWHGAVVVVVPCKNRVLFNLTTQNRKLLNPWWFQKEGRGERKGQDSSNEEETFNNNWVEVNS